MKNFITCLFIAIILAGCTSQPNKPVQKTVVSDECDQITHLITSFSSGFNTLKMNKVNNKYKEQWYAKQSIIGSICTITTNETNQSSYQCQTMVKTQKVSVKKHQQVAQLLRQCLHSKGWYERQKETASSILSTFVLDTTSPVITLTTNKINTGFSTRFEIAPALGL